MKQIKVYDSLKTSKLSFDSALEDIKLLRTPVICLLQGILLLGQIDSFVSKLAVDISPAALSVCHGMT